MDALPALVAYPQGTVGTDDRPSWQGAPYSSGADDVRFTSDLLDRLEADLCVDPGRVYASGKSNGAGFAGLLACRLADRLAAVAPVAGAGRPYRLQMNAEQRELSAHMLGAWSAFVGSRGPWNRFTEGGQRLASLRPATPGVTSGHRVAEQHHCALWNEILRYGPTP